MKRLYILIIFLIMGLSFGNSGSANESTSFPFQKRTTVIKALSKAHRLIAGKLDSLFTSMNVKGSFNGCVLVAKAGKIIFKKSLGILDKTSNNALSDSSMFQLASVSKVITATAVLMLHEREMIDINKSFKYYFPDFPYEGITIKELLNHRSGLPNYIYALNNEIYQPNYQMSNMDMYNYLIAKNPKPYLKPNTRFNYCNTNYALLALLIEKITGSSYSRFLKDELFTPLGMNNTATIKDIDLNGNNVTRPYDLRWKPVEFDASDYVLGDKSIYSTPYDLFLFSEALYQNKIIKYQTQEMAYTAFSREQKTSNYGFGWRMKNFNDPLKKEVYHNGWWHGYRSSFHRRLNDTLTVVILSNQLNNSTYQTHKIYEILDNSKTDESAIDEE
ncbi:MAG: serine hydrolase domain-containing protein [Bacteroidota bacterium]